MADITFNTTAGQTIERELLVAYLNTGTTSTPVWSPLGKRVNDSSIAFDWQDEQNVDILGATRINLKKPILTESFEPMNPDAGDAAILKIWNAAVKDHDVSALASMDVLVVHLYAGTAATAMFAERYPSSAVKVTGLGGEGGGALAMPIEITFGGERSVGTAAISQGVVTFTAG